jgi:enoyl-CoA hydratase
MAPDDRGAVEGQASTVVVAPTDVEGVWSLLLNRPPVNAMSIALYRAVVDELEALTANDQVKCLVIGSALSKGFCAGADRNELSAQTGEGFSLVRWEQREAASRAFVTAVTSFPVPIVAALDGYVVGAGFVLASLCDLRFATPRTWFSIPELEVTRIGGAAHALRVLPQAIARAMCFQGLRLGAARAETLGFLNQMVEAEALWSVATEAAAAIARHERPALRLAKRALGLSENQPIMTGYEIESQHSFRLAARDPRTGAEQ